MFTQIVDLFKLALQQAGIWLDTILNRIGYDVIPWIISGFLFFVVVRTLLMPLIGTGLSAGSDVVSKNETVKKNIKGYFGK